MTNKPQKILFFSLILIFLLFASISVVFAFLGPGSNPGVGGGQLYLDTNQNLGFGTTDPTPSTSGFGKIFAVASSTNPGIMIKNTSGRSFILYASSSGAFAILDDTDGADRLVIDSSGNVTIGGNITGSSFSGNVSSANVSSGVFGSLQGNGSFAFPASLGVATSGKTGLPQSLSVYGGGYFSGNVGIGTTEPGVKLDVSNNVNNSAINLFNDVQGIRVANPNNTVGAYSSLKLETYSDHDGAYIRGINRGNNIIDFSIGKYWSGGVTSVDWLTILNSGNVGIGTSNPAYKLEVDGSFAVSGTSTLSGDWQLVGGALGNVNLNGNNITAVNKLTVSTIDPLYEIGGQKYATYVSDTIGLKMETYGKASLTEIPNPNDQIPIKSQIPNYSFVLDFKNTKYGSDLWLFWQTIDEGKNMEDMVLILTPEGKNADLWYELIPKERKIIIYGDKPVKFSYHLVAPRHDSKSWPTLTTTNESGVPLKIR